MTLRQAVHRSSSQWAAINRLSPWKFWLMVALVIVALEFGSFYIPASR